MISEEQMKHILEAQQASFMALLTEMQRNWGPASRENKRKQVEQRINEFVYDPEGGVNFEAWFRKYEGLFEEKGAELDDKTKVEIILLKLAQREHERAVRNTTEEVLKNKYMERMENAAGRCTKTKISLKVKPEKQPAFKQSRRVPFAVQSSVEAELERLQEKGIIYPTNYSAWAAPVVAVKKPNGQIRLCADYSTGLNDALEDYHYPLPTLEQIFATLNGGKVFARIDLSEAYLQIEVDEKSQELLTINTHKGLFRYTRLNYGVKTAPSVFQQIMDTMLTNVPGTIAYLDDILVVGSSEEELTQRLDQVVDNLIDYGLKVNMEKSEFLRKEIHYLGFIVNENGRAPDPERVKAFQNMKVPKNTKELQSFMGLVSYYGPFITGLHSLKPPLSRLLCKDVEFVWSPECQNAFDAIKTKICDSTMLSHFEADKETIVQADASDYGLGGVLLQKDADGRVQPIMHAARSLTKAERNYSQIEKEALAIIFAVQRFHLFIYGRPFTLRTDHQPLKFLLEQQSTIIVETETTTLLNYDDPCSCPNTPEASEVSACKSTATFDCSDSCQK
nr:unnamed protein product [Spirometra erinaceieuropaei]